VDGPRPSHRHIVRPDNPTLDTASRTRPAVSWHWWLEVSSMQAAVSRPGQAARRRTSQTVAAMSSTDSASSQPPSIHWKGQNRLAGW
jgi:hypothetical protein